MSPPPETVLAEALQKLTGSRTWLRRIKTPRWKPKLIVLRADATLVVNPPDSSFAHLPARHFLIVPGGARRGTHLEQLRHSACHIFALTAVSHMDAHDRDADRHLIFLAADRASTVDKWVEKATELSYARFGFSKDRRLLRPFLSAWGHVQELEAKEVVKVARVLNYRLSETNFGATWQEIYKKRAPSKVSAERFMEVMTHFANINCLKGLVPRDMFAAETLPIEVVAEALGDSVEGAAKRLADEGMHECSPRFLLHLLFTASNSVIDPERAAENHDMSQPLNRYLISSSHNTYLTGDQLQSDSTAEMYRIVLERGCRCVEIDVWEGDSGEPIVRHGHTITSTETLENVLRVINEHAFSHGNVFPVILSIENHMEWQQQIVAAKQIREIFGDTLYAPGAAARECKVLPSPASLVNKIIIKAKTGLSVLQPEFRAHGAVESGLDHEDEDSDEPGESREQTSSSPSFLKVPASKKKASEGGVAPEFIDVVYLSGGSRKALTALWKAGQSGKDTFLAASCVSVNEKKLLEAYLDNCTDLVRDYNSHGLTRVYPKGSRVDSSNYIPLLAHFMGCQIVALNWQSRDAGLAVNEARFLTNAGRGYILPPAVPEPDKPGTIEMHLLSAFLLPKPKKTVTVTRDLIDPYCWVKVYDSDFAGEEEYTYKYTTATAKSNGFAPSWYEKATIPIRNRALAVITIRVYDHDYASGDDLVGYISIPVALLRTGVRCLPLKAKDGTPLAIPGALQHPSILCAIRWV